MKRSVILRFVKKNEYLTEVEVNNDIRIPNIGEHYHYVSGFEFNFLSTGSVVDIHTTYSPRVRCETDEKIVVVIDICK